MSKRGNQEGTYTQKPNGSWRCRVEVNGQRISATAKTQAAALKAAKDLARRVGDRRGSDTVADVVTAWSALPLAGTALGARKPLRATTRDQYLSLLRSRVLPSIGSTKVERLTKRQVADLFPLGDGSSASSLRSTYAALVRVLDYAVERGVVAVNIAREVSRPAAPERRSRHVDREAVSRILAAAAGDRLEVAAWLGFGCGLRRGESLGLRWSDVDLDAGVLSVSGSVTRSSAGLVRGATKTERGRRLVPMPPVVVEQLRAHKKRQAQEQLAAGSAWQPLGMVMTNEIGGMVEPRRLSRQWQQWSKAAGVEDTGTHVARHYAASTLLASGAASVADVAAQLGHDPAVLLNTYAVAVVAGQRAASNVLGDSLLPALGPSLGPTHQQQHGTA